MLLMRLSTVTSRCNPYLLNRTKFLHTKRVTSSTEESSTIERQTSHRHLREAPWDSAPMLMVQQLASTVAMAMEAETGPTEGDSQDLMTGGPRGRGSVEEQEQQQEGPAVRLLHTMIRSETGAPEIEVVLPGEVTLIHISLAMAVREAAAERSDPRGRTGPRGKRGPRETRECPGMTERLEMRDLRGMIDPQEMIGTGMIGALRDREMKGGTTVGRTAVVDRHLDMTGGESGSESSETFIDDRSCRQVTHARIQWLSMLSMLSILFENIELETWVLLENKLETKQHLWNGGCFSRLFQLLKRKERDDDDSKCENLRARIAWRKKSSDDFLKRFKTQEALAITLCTLHYEWHTASE